MNFSKYHGAGNDFIIVDDRQRKFDLNQSEILSLCNRRTGIGADGLMLLRSHDELDFEMVYFNADGAVGSMCGNGGRCIAAFAKRIGVIDDAASFIASDGPHAVRVLTSERVALKMEVKQALQVIDEHSAELDTGSPHYIQFVNDLAEMDVVKEGRAIRMSDPYREHGINVNFVEIGQDVLFIRTYERGVEDETLACGTGITAAAVAAHALFDREPPIKFKALGGYVDVDFDANDGQYSNIWKTGPVKHVFDGIL